MIIIYFIKDLRPIRLVVSIETNFILYVFSYLMLY
jgi:hypothetical protein